ncbi:hypothetical protein [Kitasatospora griseola]|uniref:hypothetical protein n=1 Tax=Kitasatospora griseola TaxID=2064 RepID=UPI0037F3FB9A
MPKPQFTPADYVNPDAPEGERRLRPDHRLVRDRSYEYSRRSQQNDLWKSSLICTAMDPWESVQDPSRDLPGGVQPGAHLMVFIKERERGDGYVADFLYDAADLPVTVYGILANEGSGLGVVELELWRLGWGYGDDWGDFIGPGHRDEQNDGDDEDTARPVRAPITSDVLRRIPLGQIIARAQAELADRSWEQEGITVLGGPGPNRTPAPASTLALENANRLSRPGRRGRPVLDDELLRQVAHAYLSEAVRGPGLTARLAERFDRPEPTIKDWIKAARNRGFLSPAIPGRRAAGPGPRLSHPVPLGE